MLVWVIFCCRVKKPFDGADVGTMCHKNRASTVLSGITKPSVASKYPA